MNNEPHFPPRASENEPVEAKRLANLGAVALKTDSADDLPKADNKVEVAKAFVRRHGEQLSLFARDSSLHFVPSASAETFAFSPETFEIQVPTSWFASEKYNENELQFANYHELAHFIDMRKNPVAFLDNFQHMERDANSLAADYLKTHRSPYSQQDISKFYYDELHSLYNVFDDIYVNNLVFGRNHFFDYGDGRASVSTLYEKLGFAGQDLTSRPLHEQMIFALLRDEMLGSAHEKSIVDPRVTEVFSKKKLGHTISELIESDLKPKRGVLLDPEHRYKIIRSLIQPEYLKLLDISLKEKDSQQNNSANNSTPGDNAPREDTTTQQQYSSNSDPESGNIPKQSSSSGFNPFGDSHESAPQDIFDSEPSEEAIKNILKSFQESDDVAKMSPEERTKYQAQKRRDIFDKEHNITPEERKTNDNIKTKIRPIRKEMRKFWHNLIGKSIEYHQTKISHQRKGRLNIGSFIAQYPSIVESERRGDLRTLEVYDRNGLERKVIDQPERIDITLLVDCSGSMGSNDKIAAARESAALLMYSVKDFNDELALSRRQTHSKLHANTEVIIFGSSYDKTKSFDSTIGHSTNDAEIIKSISSINSELGSTDDAAPLAKIYHSLSPEDKSRLKSKKLKKIIFEITDGEPDNPAITAEHLKRLSEEGVLVVGFQIGDVSSRERSTFEQVWQSASDNQQGIYIGANISDLPRRLMAALSKSLNNIII